MNEEMMILSPLFDVTSALYAEMSDTMPDKGHVLVFEKLCKLGCTLVNAEKARFWYRDKYNKVLRTVSDEKNILVLPENDSGIVGKAINEGKVIVVNGMSALSDTDGNAIVMPISDTKGQYIGAFQVTGKKDGDFDEKEDVRRLSVCAVVCGLSLESDIFADKANFCEVTGCRNRKGFFSDYDWKWAPVLKSTFLSCVLMEINDFGDISYNYGSRLADEVLTCTAKTIGEFGGENSGVYRWSADSFLLMLPGADRQAALQKGKDIAECLGSKAFSDGENSFSVTVDMGTSEFSAEKSTAENLRTAETELSMDSGEL